VSHSSVGWSRITYLRKAVYHFPQPKNDPLSGRCPTLSAKKCCIAVLTGAMDADTECLSHTWLRNLRFDLKRHLVIHIYPKPCQRYSTFILIASAYTKPPEVLLHPFSVWKSLPVRLEMRSTHRGPYAEFIIVAGPTKHFLAYAPPGYPRKGLR